MIESKIRKEAEIPPLDFAIVGGTADLTLRQIFSLLFHRFLDAQIPRSCALFAAATVGFRSVAYQTRDHWGPMRSGWNAGGQSDDAVLCVYGGMVANAWMVQPLLVIL